MKNAAHPFSAVIITYNVAHTLADCLTALQQVADEILVLDSASTDGTIEICEKMGVRIVQQEWLGYSATKNIGHALAKNDWILSIDADEVLSEELIETINKLKPLNGHIYALDRITNYCGKWIKHCGWYPDWKVRIFNKNNVSWQGDFVHETLAVPADYQEVRLSGKLYHYSYKDSEDHLRRIEKYARLAAQELFQKGKKATFIKRYLSPPARFIRTYIMKKGFLDGKEGFIISSRNAYMVRLRYRLLAELWRRKESLG